MKYLNNPTNAALDKEIKGLKGIVANVSDRVQAIAVGIIEHDIAHGDCSRAVPLVNALRNAEQRRFLIQFLAYFGAIGIKVENGVATGVGHIDVKSKRYNRPNLEAAKQHRWDEPYGADGKKAEWFQGPNPNLFVSGTLGDVGDNVLRFADRLEKQLTQEKDNGAGQMVPVFALTQQERTEVETALGAVRALGKRIMAREAIAENERETAELNEVIQSTDNLFRIGAKAAENVEDTPVGERAAG